MGYFMQLLAEVIKVILVTRGGFVYERYAFILKHEHE